MAQAVGTDLVRDLVADGRAVHRRQSSFTLKLDTPKPTPPADPLPLETPYIGLVDRIAEAFAAEDKAEAILKARRLKDAGSGK
jgi:hypothetical protein